MNMHVNGPLRNAFDEIADSAPAPTGLAPLALHRGRRQRRMRLAASGGIAAVCAGIIGVAALAAPGGPDANPGNGVTADFGSPAEPKPVVITAYSGIQDPKLAKRDPGPTSNYSLLRNPKTGAYERVPYRYAMPSPDGKRVLVETGDNSLKYPSRVGVMDRSTKKVRWIERIGTGASSFPGYADHGTWSPDGQRILFDFRPRIGRPSFVLVDPDTLKARVVDLPALQEDAAAVGLSWSPDSNGIVLTRTRTVAENKPDIILGIRFYDLTGKMLREIPATAALRSRAAYSPDGTLMALSSMNWSGPREFQLVDVNTGEFQKTVTVAEGDRLLGWADQEHLVVYRWGGSDGPGRQPDVLVVVNLAGEETRTIDLTEMKNGDFSQEVFLD